MIYTIFSCHRMLARYVFVGTCWYVAPKCGRVIHNKHHIEFSVKHVVIVIKLVVLTLKKS